MRSDHRVCDKHDERDGGDGVDETSGSSFKEDADGNCGGNSGDEVDGEVSLDMDTEDDDDYTHSTNRRPRKIRNIVAASSLSMANEISVNQSTAEGFTFLTQEAYSCSCLVKNTPSLRNDFASNCKVLVFFGLVFFKQWRVIFCPEHNSFIAMVELAKHLRDVHNDWTSHQKLKESEAMASHVADSLGLNLTQTQSDFLPHLPKELDSPLVPSDVFESYQCPKCFSWQAKNSGNGNPERYIRWKHLARTCRARPAGGFKSIESIVIDDPHLTYRVHLYPMGSYTFTVRNNWTEEETGSVFDVLFKRPTSESSPNPSSNVIERSQLWPLQLRWVDYDTEIAASSHVASLRKLIAFPKRRSTNFLDKSLAYVRFYSRMYIRVIVSLLKDSHEGIGQILVSGYVL